MQKNTFTIKKDKYKSSRGGYSRILNVFCRKCESLVLVYQKDGPGNLRRLYLDRILDQTERVNLQNKDIDDVPALKCPSCSELLGTAYIYPKEKRPAYRLFQDSVVKRIRKKDINRE